MKCFFIAISLLLLLVILLMYKYCVVGIPNENTPVQFGTIGRVVPSNEIEEFRLVLNKEVEKLRKRLEGKCLKFSCDVKDSKGQFSINLSIVPYCTFKFDISRWALVYWINEFKHEREILSYIAEFKASLADGV